MSEWTSAPDLWCARLCSQLLVSATHGENVVVVRTVAGGAPMLAAALDAVALGPILGTVAGNDTVLLIARTSEQAAQLAETLRATATGSARPSGPKRDVAPGTAVTRYGRLASPDRTHV